MRWFQHINIANLNINIFTFIPKCISRLSKHVSHLMYKNSTDIKVGSILLARPLWKFIKISVPIFNTQLVPFSTWELDVVNFVYAKRQNQAATCEPLRKVVKKLSGFNIHLLLFHIQVIDWVPHLLILYKQKYRGQRNASPTTLKIS